MYAYMYTYLCLSPFCCYCCYELARLGRLWVTYLAYLTLLSVNNKLDRNRKVVEWEVGSFDVQGFFVLWKKAVVILSMPFSSCS